MLTESAPPLVLFRIVTVSEHVSLTFSEIVDSAYKYPRLVKIRHDGFIVKSFSDHTLAVKEGRYSGVPQTQ